MRARMKNPAFVVPGSGEALQALAAAVEKGGVPKRTLDLVHLRIGLINGCGVCLDLDARVAKHSGETNERLLTVAGWRETPYFTDAERAALALAEAVTRLSDRADPVPDSIWEEAARHYDERALGTVVLHIALTNTWNRLNVATRQVAGEWAASQQGRAVIEPRVNAPANEAEPATSTRS
jgi:AhpD family alkylhydroperoxidase